MAVPQDSGWAWLIMLACFGNFALVVGTIRSFGIVFVQLIDYYGGSNSATATTFALAGATSLLLAPVYSSLAQLFTVRVVTMIGGLLCCLGFLFCSLASTLHQVVFAYGIIFGIGCGCLLTPGPVLVTQYFTKYRSLANALVFSGSGLGAMVMPHVVASLISEYGLNGTLMLLAGLMFQTFALSALYRPVSFYSQNIDKKTADTEPPDKYDEVGTLTEPVLESISIKPSDEEVPVVTQPAGARTSHYRKQPRSYSLSISTDQNLHTNLGQETGKQRYIRQHSMQKQTKPRTASHGELFSDESKQQTPSSHSFKFLPFSPKQLEHLGHVVLESTLSFETIACSPNIALELIENLDSECEDQTSQCGDISSPESKDTFLDKSKDDATALETKDKLDSCLLEGTNGALDVYHTTGEEGGIEINSLKPSVFKRLFYVKNPETKELEPFLDFSFVRSGRLCFFFAGNAFQCLGWFLSMAVPPRLMELGYSMTEVSLALTVLAGADMAGRIGCGIVGDRPLIRPHRAAVMAASSMVFGVVVGTLGPIIKSYWSWLLLLAVAGPCSGTAMASSVVVLADIAGKENLAKCWGVCLFFQGFTVLCAPVVIGAIADTAGNYMPTFLFMAIGAVAAAFFHTVGINWALIRRGSRRDESKQNVDLKA